MSKILIIAPGLTKNTQAIILSLMHPEDIDKNSVNLGDPFMPIKSCMFDSNPRKLNFEMIMHLERTPLRQIVGAERMLKKASNPQNLIQASGNVQNNVSQMKTDTIVKPVNNLQNMTTMQKLNETFQIPRSDRASERFLCNLFEFAKTRLSGVSFVTGETVNKIRDLLDLAMKKAADLQSRMLSQNNFDAPMPPPPEEFVDNNLMLRNELENMRMRRLMMNKMPAPPENQMNVNRFDGPKNLPNIPLWEQRQQQMGERFAMKRPMPFDEEVEFMRRSKEFCEERIRGNNFDNSADPSFFVRFSGNPREDFGSNCFPDNPMQGRGEL